MKYKDYREIDVHGNYFNIDNTEWTIIFERDACKSEENNHDFMKYGKYFAFIQTVVIALFQKIYLKDDLKDDEKIINSLINEIEKNEKGK